MKMRVKWVEGVCFMAETESGHAIVMDGAPEGGGRIVGPRPMETLLSGTGGCSAYASERGGSGRMLGDVGTDESTSTKLSSNWALARWAAAAGLLSSCASPAASLPSAAIFSR